MDTVCALLLESGEFSGMEVLRASGLLTEHLATASNNGEDSPTEQVVVEDVPRAGQLLREVRELAESLGLEVEESDGHAHPALGDPDLEALLSSTWRPPGGARQLDLFVDSASAFALERVRETLLARDVRAARRECERLVGHGFDGQAVTHARTLIAALEAPSIERPAEARERLLLIEAEWLRAASALLGKHGRDFLAPLWGEVGRALEGVPFDLARPDLHASRAWAQSGDHRAVLHTIRATPGHATQPELLARLAESYYALGRRLSALQCWFSLCRLDPRAFERRIGAPGFPDRAMVRAWHEAQNSDLLEEDLAPVWFPAWLLIAEPALAARLPEASESDGPSRAFNALRALQGEEDSPSVGLRAELRALHPGLFAAYMATREPR